MLLFSMPNGKFDDGEIQFRAVDKAAWKTLERKLLTLIAEEDSSIFSSFHLGKLPKGFVRCLLDYWLAFMLPLLICRIKKLASKGSQ